MCSGAPVALAFYEAIRDKFGSRVFFLGSVGDSNHATRRSGHNCGEMRELDCTNPDFAHAVDIGCMDDAVGFEIQRIAFEQRQVHYTIFKGEGQRPRWRGGARFASAGHDHHVHISFTCGSTFFTNFDFTEGFSMADVERVLTRLNELDADLPEAALFERIVDRQLNQGVALSEVRQDVNQLQLQVAALAEQVNRLVVLGDAFIAAFRPPTV